MNDEMFAELLESVREGGAILRGKKAASRRFEHAAPDARVIRTRLGLSQREFALLFGISVKTLQNWEQGQRRPEGPARVLLMVAEKHPGAILDTLHAQQSAEQP